MSKRGRPRHNGERYPGGRLRPGDYRSDTQIRRIVDQGLALGLDPMLGSQAGRLRLQGHLNDRHLAVIDHIGRVYGRYEQHAGLQRHTQSPAYAASKYQAARGPIGEAGSTIIGEEDAAAVRADFLALQQIMAEFPSEARGVIERLCVDDLHVPTSFVPDLLVLLERIDAALCGRRQKTPLARGGLPVRRRVPVSP
jgi:hypothetical protein